MCKSHFFNKFAGLQPVALLKKETPTQVFSSESFATLRKRLFVTRLQAAVSGKC